MDGRTGTGEREMMMSFTRSLCRINGVLLSLCVCWPLSAAQGQTINEDMKIFASDGSGGDRFGISQSASGGLIAVGVSSDDDNGSGAGAVYIFDSVNGNELVKLLAQDGSNFDAFGIAVGIDNGIVAVGAFGDDDNGSGSGSAYLFDASTGAQLFKLIADDGVSNDKFGKSIAINGNIVVVGAPNNDEAGSNSGAAYVFNVSTGLQIAKLIGNDTVGGDAFGTAVAVENGIVAVGSPLDDFPDIGQNAGSVYVFDGVNGVQIFHIIGGDSDPQDQFGTSVDFNGGIIAVGAVRHHHSGPIAGSAYLFDGSQGFEISELNAIDGVGGDLFGGSIAIDNGIVVVGASGNDENGSGAGSAYFFDATNGEQLNKLLASDATTSDVFGKSVAISDGIASVGADLADGLVGESGAVYLFGAQPQGCPADLNGDGSLNFFDVSAFLTAFAANNPIADFSFDGAFNFFDVSAFLTAFAAGCP